MPEAGCFPFLKNGNVLIGFHIILWIQFHCTFRITHSDIIGVATAPFSPDDYLGLPVMALNILPASGAATEPPPPAFITTAHIA